MHESPSGSGLQPVLSECWLPKQGWACRLQETVCALKSSHWPQLPSGWSDPKSQRWGFFPVPVVEPKLYQREARFWGGQAGSATKPFMRQAPACSAVPFYHLCFLGKPHLTSRKQFLREASLSQGISFIKDAASRFWTHLDQCSLGWVHAEVILIQLRERQDKKYTDRHVASAAALGLHNPSPCYFEYLCAQDPAFRSVQERTRDINI